MSAGNEHERIENPAWRAFGAEKEAWKANGNRFSADELKALGQGLADLEIVPCPETVLSAD